MMRHPRATLAFVVLGTAVGLAAQSQPQSQTQTPTQQPVFRSGVDLVTVDVLVVDKDGRPIPELKAEDFTVAVDGKPRRITSVERLTHYDRFATAPDRTQMPNLRREDRVMMRAEVQLEHQVAARPDVRARGGLGQHDARRRPRRDGGRRPVRPEAGAERSGRPRVASSRRHNGLHGRPPGHQERAHQGRRRRREPLSLQHEHQPGRIVLVRHEEPVPHLGRGPAHGMQLDP